LSSPLSSPDAQVIVIGAGVVGAASAHALARRGVSTLVLEAEREPALGASGTN
jgi:glycine/D-amino acid oxidase-like deaminating enzyme